MAPFIVCIDGIVGAGKSTLMEKLAKDYICYPEPLTEWTLLPLLYTNQQVYGPPFQFQVLLSQFKQLQTFPTNGTILVERCPWTSRHIFAPLMLDDECLKTYDRFYQTLAYDVDCFIYLELDPYSAFNRLMEKSDSKITLGYLCDLHKTYSFKLLTGSTTVFVVDASLSEDNIEQEVRTLLTKSVLPRKV